MSIDSQLDRLIGTLRARVERSDDYRKLKALEGIRQAKYTAATPTRKRRRRVKRVIRKVIPAAAPVVSITARPEPPTICDLIRRVVRDSPGKYDQIQITDQVQKLSGQEKRFDRKNCSSQITQLVKKGEFLKDADYRLAPSNQLLRTGRP